MAASAPLSRRHSASDAQRSASSLHSDAAAPMLDTDDDEEQQQEEQEMHRESTDAVGEFTLDALQEDSTAPTTLSSAVSLVNTIRKFRLEVGARKSRRDPDC